MDEVRLQKYLAEAGVASRRKAEELIAQGHVKVNGILVTVQGIKVSSKDVIEVDDKRVEREGKKVYIMLNKPPGFVTTAKDQFARKTVMDLIFDVEERVFPVGRLDYDTSGLLLLTNDGNFTYKLTHPKHELKKVYIASIKGIPSDEKLKIFENGLKIEDYVTAPAKIRILKRGVGESSVEIIIHEGKNRQVRKMCKAIGHPVLKLKRCAIEHLHLGNLREGCWRYLNKEELKGFQNILS
jgi:23S rRNA pseudouridine2605 synthase